jgi:predicted small lipoprotein YifL
MIANNTSNFFSRQRPNFRDLIHLANNTDCSHQILAGGIIPAFTFRAFSMRNAIITANTILMIGLILLAGCGQTGPLYPPEGAAAPPPQTESTPAID